MYKTFLKLSAAGTAITLLLAMLMIAGCKAKTVPGSTTHANNSTGTYTGGENLASTGQEGVEDLPQDIDIPISGNMGNSQSGESEGELVVSRPDNSGTGQTQTGQNPQLQNPQPSTPSTNQSQTTDSEQSQSSQPSQPETTEPEGTEPADPIAAMTYEKFRGLSSAEKMAFRALFVDKNGNVDDEAFIVWYNNAQKEYEAGKDKTDDLDMSTAPRD